MLLTKEKITEILAEKSEYLASEYGVKKIGLFGSYAKGVPVNPTSDIDIVVEFDRPIGFKFMELADYLEEILGKPVDLLTQKARFKVFDTRISHSRLERVSSMSNRTNTDF